MSTWETAEFVVKIVFSTESGELPMDSEIEEMITAQMDGELDPETGLRALVVRVTERSA